MIGKARHAGSKDSIPARAVACLTGIVVPCGGALAQSDRLSSVNHAGSFDPSVVWEVLIGSIVVCAFLGSVALSIHLALRRFKRTQARKTAFVRSALNNLSHGVVMTDPQARVVFCNDRYLDIYGLTRADISTSMTADDLLAAARARPARRRRRGFLRTSRKRRRSCRQAALRQIGPGETCPAAERRLDRDP